MTPSGTQPANFQFVANHFNQCANVAPIYIYTLFQNCILLKDSRISPFIFSKIDFVLKVICTGVSLHGATSKRDSMWHSPVFTCIRANRIPVNRIKRTVVRYLDMHVNLPSHWALRPLSLIKCVMWHVTDVLKCSDARKKCFLPSGFSWEKQGIERARYIIDRVSQDLFPSWRTISKTTLNFPGYKKLRG